MNLTCNPDALKDVPKEIMDALPTNLEITELETELEKERDEFWRTYRSFNQAPPKIHQECEQLRRQIALLKKQREREIKIEYQIISNASTTKN